jgi:parallel beta-helix repeat protein
VGFGGGIALFCDTTIARTMVKIIGNTIAYNQATSSSTSYGGTGGGIDVQFCNILLVDNQITNNTVSGAQPEGGAGLRLIFSTGSSLVRDNTISFNSSFNPTSGLWGMGGGIRAWETVGLIIQDNQFEGNESAGGGGIATYSTQGTVISGNTFLNNYCAAGGGIWEEQTIGSIISGNTFNGNSANYHGGGIMIIECSPKVYNNLIINNKAVFNGGGIYVGDQNSEAQIINNTIVADSAGVYGGGICSRFTRLVEMLRWIILMFRGAGQEWGILMKIQCWRRTL